jgi:hypothetical protein
VEKMAVISCFKYDKSIDKNTVIEKLSKLSIPESWFEVRESKYEESEVSIQFYYKKPLAEILRKALSQEELNQLLEDHKDLKNAIVVRRTYAFINTRLKTVEIYSGNKSLVKTIKEAIEKNLGIELVWLMNEYKERIKPNIKYLNPNRRYTVVVDKNKLIISNQQLFKFRPRYEIRQMVQQLATVGRL